MLTSEYQSVTIIPEQIQDQDNLKEQDKQTSHKSKTANINLISIVSVDIFTASKTLSCHLLDTQSEVDNKQPLLLHSTYHEINDELRLYFNNSTSTNITFFKSEEEDIKVAMDDSKRVTALLFCNSSKKICRVNGYFNAKKVGTYVYRFLNIKKTNQEVQEQPKENRE
ncbi:hypothetical protein RhiirA5_380628 [Rhizophagus irregularis]|uniref:Uncharacterized protein n=1 Tax=Rhizophagus irregularis TaxID=588596 RepID=A0A2I1EEH6_9GLOM|nr:hypothetical protein RhiirA5_380628 [Rhizophagus irregularis]PKC74507.1 hypothetical protein RhiirA1_388083 [Rhizophagus irregularis]PKY20525.1 hypothetical protein RhiirB3_384951 [Rhizophagus irregularis]